jgi:hypothetical protein
LDEKVIIFDPADPNKARCLSSPQFCAAAALFLLDIATISVANILI